MDHSNRSFAGEDKKENKGTIRRRRGAKIARVAVMRRLTTILWHMLRKKERYRYASPSKRHQEFEAYAGTAETQA